MRRVRPSTLASKTRAPVAGNCSSSRASRASAKSRLAAELTNRARDAGAQVAWGRCWEAGGAPPYWPWAEVLGALADHVGVGELRDALGAAADDLGQIVSALAPASSPDARLAPDTARFRLFEAVVRLCRLGTADVPMVAVVDDLHVADPSSLLLLQFVSAHLDRMGLVIVATYREAHPAAEGFTDLLAEILRERNVTRLRLGGLDEAAVAAMVAAAFGASPSPRLVARVRDLTDGNPLYVGEAARLLVTESGDDTIEFDRLPIPRDVRETVLRRLAQLSDPCQHVLELAAVLGRDFPLDVLGVLASGDLDPITALDEATAAEVIIDSPGRLGHLRFAHAVMSEALYQEIPSLRRRRLHDEAGRALEVLRGRDLGPRLAELARHCCASLPVGPVDRAVRYAREAGSAPCRQLAYEEGARLFEMALQALAGADGSVLVRGCRAHGAASLPRRCAGTRWRDTDAAKVTFLEAADLARQLSDCAAARASGARLRRPVSLVRAGTDRRIIPLLREALEALPRDDSALRVQLLARLAEPGATKPRSGRATS